MSSRLYIKPWVILLIICLFLSIIWFHTGFIEGGGEEGLAFYNLSRSYTLANTVWWEYDGGLPTLAWLPQIKTFFITSFLFEKLHIPNFVLQAGIFGIILITGSLSVYFLIREVLPKNIKYTTIPFISAVFYIFNPYSMTQIWGRGLQAQFFAFALLPLSIYLFLLGLKKRQYIYLLLLSLVSGVYSSAYGLTTFVIVYWSVLTIVFLYWFVNDKTRKKNLIFYLSYYGIALILWGLCNMDWLLPTILEGNKIYGGHLSNPQENISTLIGVSQNYKPLVLIRLLQDTFFASPYALSPLYMTFAFQAISYLYPIFLFIGIWAVIRKKEFRSMGIILSLFIWGIIVSLGANPPFGWLFVWIFERVPFLQGFRNPYEKYGIVYAFAYAPLFALGVYYFFTIQYKKRITQLIGLILLLILVCGVFVWPMWTGRVIAGVDRKLGIEVPDDYKKVNNWLLENNKDNARVLLTPLWPGDGAFYKWNNGTEYNGLDPVIYLLDSPAVSNIPSNLPWYTDFMRSIRRKLYAEDVSGALSLLRINYIVSRNDAMYISKAEENHTSYLTNAIYPPQPTDSLLELVCDEAKSLSDGTTPATIACEIDEIKRDWSKSNYLHVRIKVDEPAYIDLAIRDAQLNSPRWYAREGTTYLLPKDTWTNLIISLGAPTEVNYRTDFSHITQVQLYAHPVSRPLESVRNLEIQGMWVDSGEEQKLNNFIFVQKFGNLDLYKTEENKIPPEFGLLNSIERVNSFDELIVTALQKKNELNNHGFIVTSQNNTNKAPIIDNISSGQIVDSDRIAQTKYWVKLKNKEKAYIILSKTYNSEWKLIPNVDKKELHGSFFDEIRLLKKAFLSEENHYVVNGYANLWKVNGESDKYAAVFIPQIYADIGKKISLFSIVSITVVIILFVIKRKFYSNK